VGVAAVWLASCSELGSPSGVFAISPLLLPSPGMVMGDTMRDSTGAIAPLRVIAFSASGDTIAGTTATFVTLNTKAHLVGGTILVADDTGGARVLGGIGALQTLPETVKVTLSPDTLYAADSAHHLKTYSILGGDTLVTSAELTARVSHKSGATLSDVNAVIVRYSIVRAPPAKGTIPTITLMNGSLVSTRDTTLGGRAARTVRLRVSQLTSANVDSAVILATASYRGATIGSVTFTVVFKNQ
jgi:hypothetical protein